MDNIGDDAKSGKSVYMNLTKMQLEILHILWVSDTPLSLQEITERSRYRIAGSAIVPIIIENLLAKEAVYQSGVFHSYSDKRKTVLAQYSANLRFDEYYAERFKNIAPRNLFNLMERMLQSEKLTPKQLRELSALLNEKLSSFES